MTAKENQTSLKITADHTFSRGKSQGSSQKTANAFKSKLESLYLSKNQISAL